MSNRYSDDTTVEQCYQDTRVDWQAYWDAGLDANEDRAKQMRIAVWRKRIAILETGPQTRQVKHQLSVTRAALAMDEE